MESKKKFPPWLVFVNRAPDDDSWLQLMVVNPINGETSTLSDTLIETDWNEPGPQHLSTASPI
jgi:hypothetical protein